jgi:MarR family transcriptional regulator, organic hydroperoxide resistance regulator
VLTEHQDGTSSTAISLLLSNAERAFTRLIEAQLEGLSIEQWRALTLLSDREGHSMSELAEYAMLPAPSLTRLIDQLVSEALAYRRIDPLDRRRILVFLAKRGVRLHARLVTRLSVLDDAIAADASEQAESLRDDLNHVLSSMGAVTTSV